MAASSAEYAVRNMYTIPHDLRVFMTPVLDHDSETGSYVFASDGVELVFKDRKELVRHLAFHTDTHGKACPGSWSNDLIPRQFARGRASRTWNVKYTSTYSCGRHAYSYSWERTESWDYWFHDASGRTIDVRGFWPDVIRAVCSGDTAEAAPSARYKGCCPKRKKHGSGHWEKRHASGKARVGAYIRDLSERQSFCFEEDSPVFQWTPRGRLLTNSRYIADPDLFDGRSRHSTGWKEHKCRHQWEHAVREREKHRKNRDRKALRRGEYAAGQM